MDQLVKMVVDKTGLSTEQAEQAVQVVLGFLKTKLPAPIASQLNGIINGDVNADNLLKTAGGDGGFLKKLFGSR